MVHGPAQCDQVITIGHSANSGAKINLSKFGLLGRSNSTERTSLERNGCGRSGLCPASRESVHLERFVDAIADVD